MTRAKAIATESIVQRLRIYPHALRAKNAYYSPDRKALLLGYFTRSDDRSRNRAARAA